jgi:predicted NBD/HSP70 family sugar kinase
MPVLTTGAQPARLARYNRAIILDLIRRFAPIARPELAERSGLAPSSVTNVVATLEQGGIVRTTGQATPARGRPARMLELNPEARYALGVNVRVTGVEAVLLNLVGNEVASTALPLQGGSDPDSAVQTVVEAVEQVVQISHVDLARVLSVGVGCPGPVIDETSVLTAPGLPHWRDVPLASQLEHRLGLPVRLESHANLGALAEFRFGIGSRNDGCDPLLYLYADHSVSTGMIINGKLFRSFDGLAGQLGHTVIDVNGPQCPCGSYGCLDVLASVGSIVRRVIVATRLGGDTTVGDRLAGDRNAVTYAAIRDAVDTGDRLSGAMVGEAIGYLSIGVANTLRQFRPRVLVLGGQLFEHGDREFELLQRSLAGRLDLFGAPPTSVVRSELGPHGPPRGAGLLVLEGFFGVPEQVLASEPSVQVPVPSFEQTPVWPRLAERGALLTPSSARVREATNLRPMFSRIRAGDPVTITLNVMFEGDAAEEAIQTKALLHWDRVAQYLGPWPNAKNSPMHLVSTSGRRATYSATLASLPPGLYEFTTIVLGASEVCAPPKGYPERNGRIEVVPTRAELGRLTRVSEPRDQHAVGADAGTTGGRGNAVS